LSPRRPSGNEPERILELYFDDNRALPELFGTGNAYLSRIEKALGVDISTIGNAVTISGSIMATHRAQETFDALWDRIQNNLPIEEADVDGALRIATSQADPAMKQMAMAAFSDKPKKVVTKRKHISPRSTTQAKYLDAIDKKNMVFGIGPAGTGKTYLAVAAGVQLLTEGKVEKLIFSRPAVEAGEHLGFLPGDMQEKIDPYLRPIYDALHDMLPQDQVVKMMAGGQIEIAPLAFMRGRTLANAYVVLDEAQNTTAMQMKMFLTRMGEHSKMVINGDASQTDLPRGMVSGLVEAQRLLRKIDDIAFVEFTAADVVRHPLVAKIINAYDAEKKVETP
jgi:phosphate starvation-inducible protein PhoH and related proteins